MIEWDDSVIYVINPGGDTQYAIDMDLDELVMKIGTVNYVDHIAVPAGVLVDGTHFFGGIVTVKTWPDSRGGVRSDIYGTYTIEVRNMGSGQFVENIVINVSPSTPQVPAGRKQLLGWRKIV